MDREDLNERVAIAMCAYRPDWNRKSVLTILATLSNRPARHLAVAAAVVASDPQTTTPKRLVEDGPWWRAAAIAVDGAEATPAYESRCHHGNRVTACVECIGSEYARTRTPQALAARDRVIAEIRARGKAELHTTPGRMK